jgi:hypothetical protein
MDVKAFTTVPIVATILFSVFDDIPWQRFSRGLALQSGCRKKSSAAI